METLRLTIPFGCVISMAKSNWCVVAHQLYWRVLAHQLYWPSIQVFGEFRYQTILVFEAQALWYQPYPIIVPVFIKWLGATSLYQVSYEGYVRDLVCPWSTVLPGVWLGCRV